MGWRILLSERFRRARRQLFALGVLTLALRFPEALLLALPDDGAMVAGARHSRCRSDDIKRARLQPTSASAWGGFGATSPLRREPLQDANQA